MNKTQLQYRTTPDGLYCAYLGDWTIFFNRVCDGPKLWPEPLWRAKAEDSENRYIARTGTSKEAVEQAILQAIKEVAQADAQAAQEFLAAVDLLLQ